MYVVKCYGVYNNAGRLLLKGTKFNAGEVSNINELLKNGKVGVITDDTKEVDETVNEVITDDTKEVAETVKNKNKRG